MTITKEKPCRKYDNGGVCTDGREHCYRCARHLDPVTQICPKCKE